MRTHSIQFDPEKHLIFDFKKELPGHSNAMQFRAYNPEDKIIDHAIYYSIGGGFIVTDAELNSPTQANHTLPYPFNTGNELFGLCKQHQCTVKDIILANEKSWREENAIKEAVNLNPYLKDMESSPYFLNYLTKELKEKYSQNNFYNEESKVYTTLNRRLQRIAIQSLKEGLRELDKRQINPKTRTAYRGPLKHLSLEEIRDLEDFDWGFDI